MGAETKGARLTAGQLIEAGLPAKVISWLRVNRWEMRELKPGTGTEDFILFAPPNKEGMPLAVQIDTRGFPTDKIIATRNFKLWLERPAAWDEFDRRPLVEIMDGYPNDDPEVILSISKPIPTSRGRERWLQIQEPTEEVPERLGQLQQRSILVSPDGTEWQEVIKGYTPRNPKPI